MCSRDGNGQPPEPREFGTPMGTLHVGHLPEASFASQFRNRDAEIFVDKMKMFAESLSHLHYAVVSVEEPDGNSFGKVGALLDHSLKRLRASSIVPICTLRVEWTHELAAWKDYFKDRCLPIICPLT